MSKYTTEIRFICEQASGYNESQGFGNINKVIQEAIPKVFNFDFPIFDEAYRNVLCTKILKHFYTREIGEETVGLWKLRLDTRLNEIMPYYNQLYKSQLIEFNPMYDTEVETTHNASRNENINRMGTNENSTDTTTKNVGDNVRYDLYSETPQGSLKNVDNEEYLTNARKLNDKNNETASGNSNSDGKYNEDTKLDNIEQYINRVKGKTGGQTYSAMLVEFRKTFLNIDLMVIDELKDLFINIW